jgi:hypothetical protein
VNLVKTHEGNAMMCCVNFCIGVHKMLPLTRGQNV